MGGRRARSARRRQPRPDVRSDVRPPFLAAFLMSLLPGIPIALYLYLTS